MFDFGMVILQFFSLARISKAQCLLIWCAIRHFPRVTVLKIFMVKGAPVNEFFAEQLRQQKFHEGIDIFHGRPRFINICHYLVTLKIFKKVDNNKW